MKPTIISAIPIPFDDRLDVDADEFAAVLKDVSPYVDRVLVEGTTGEFPALDDSERIDIYGQACSALGSDRVMAHVGHASARQASRLVAGALEAGITQIASITPYFLPATSEAIIAYYTEIASAAQGAKLYVYLFPDRTGQHVSVEAFRELMALPSVAGAKLSGSSNDLRAVYRKAMGAGQELFSGDDSILPEIMAEGGNGVVSGVSSAFPRLFAQLVDAIASEDEEQLHQVGADVREVVQLVGPTIPRLKAALAVRRGRPWRSRMPMESVDAELMERIERVATAYA